MFEAWDFSRECGIILQNVWKILRILLCVHLKQQYGHGIAIKLCYFEIHDPPLNLFTMHCSISLFESNQDYFQDVWGQESGLAIAIISLKVEHSFM